MGGAVPVATEAGDVDVSDPVQELTLYMETALEEEPESPKLNAYANSCVDEATQAGLIGGVICRVPTATDG
jgi:hypothetical protein